MKTQSTSLQAKIMAINTSNENTQKVLDYELNQLKKFIGQNILKVDGSFKAKINHVKMEDIKGKLFAFDFDFYYHTNYWFESNYGKLTLNVKTCVSGGGADRNGCSSYCIYETNRIDLFNIDKEGILQEFDKMHFHNKQFNEADILEAQTKVKAAAAEYEKILFNMPYEFRNITHCERLTRA